MKIINSLQLKARRLTNLERAQFSLSTDLKEILVGLLLGDLCAVKQRVKGNTRLHFEQGVLHKDYLYHLYNLFETYCTTPPKTSNRLPDKRTGKIYTRIKFQTCSLPCFNELYCLFYSGGEKILPTNIAELLTPLSLAYWLCDDGTFCKSTKRVRICTESYTLMEVDLLIQTLNAKWDLYCTKVANGKGYRIVIPKKSLPVVQSLLKDLMPPMMLHKIGL